METTEKSSLPAKIKRLVYSLQDLANQFENQEIKDFGKGMAVSSDCPPCMFGAALIHAGWHPPPEGVVENLDALVLFLYAEEKDPFRFRNQFPANVETAADEVSIANDFCAWHVFEDREQLLEAADRAIEALQRWVQELEAKA